MINGMRLNIGDYERDVFKDIEGYLLPVTDSVCGC
jgi:hypothetical protein